MLQIEINTMQLKAYYKLQLAKKSKVNVTALFMRVVKQKFKSK